MSRLLLVSNRLPLTAERRKAKLTLKPSAGGLATGLHSVHDPGTGLWFGWSGLNDKSTDSAPESEEWKRRGCVPIPLTRVEVRDYYEAFGNGVVWPLFHSLIDRLPLAPRGWAAYERVNQRFADAVLAELRPDDLVWVHDYQLMRVPGQIRAKAPDARIGFFLHIPFPPVEIFSALPRRERILEGLLGADLIGFHTGGYLRNFAEAVERLLGLPVQGGSVVYGGREVKLGVFPMGADIARYADPAPSRSRTPRPPIDRRLLLGVDRLDYTKGIPRRLLAFEKLLETRAELRGRVNFVQIAVPSRTDVPAYKRFRRQIDALVGRINGAYGTSAWTPVQYVARPVTLEQLVGLYRTCDVMVVTPLRDGMNLVAKEFVASRVDEDGVLVLSEFAGAADEMHEALLVNPYDIEGVAEALHDALVMAPDERRARMRSMRRRVLHADAQHWARSFLDSLQETDVGPPLEQERRTRTQLDSAIRRLVVRAAESAEQRLILLDYDGTLTPLVAMPALAAPDRALLTMLRTLAEQPGTSVHVVSGRDRTTVDTWLGGLPVGLHAEHGLWSRMTAGTEWTRADVPLTLPREPDVQSLLDDAVKRTPGTLIERKSTGVAWHYRLADPKAGAVEMRRLRSALTQLLQGEAAEVHIGHKVLEVRPSGVDKGTAILPTLEQVGERGVIIAIGDDRTDEQLFAALPDDALTIHVGDGATRARLRLGSVAEVRLLLADLTRAAYGAREAGAQCPLRASFTAAVSAGTISAASPTMP